jgi:hypothetical protein
LQKGEEEEEKSKLHAISMNLDSTAGFGRFLDLASKFNFIYVVVWHLLWEVYKATFTIPDLEFYNSYLYHFTGLVPVLCVFAVCFIFERIDIENKYTKLLSKIWVIVQFVPFNPDAVSSPVKAGVFLLRFGLYVCIANLQAFKRTPELPTDMKSEPLESKSLFLAAWVFFVPIPYLAFAMVQIYFSLEPGRMTLRQDQQTVATNPIDTIEQTPKVPVRRKIVKKSRTPRVKANIDDWVLGG